MNGLTPEAVRAWKFPLARNGYRRREVDRLLARAADDLARLAAGDPGEPPPLTPEDVEQARFAKRRAGYEMVAVDEFLDQLAAELGRARAAAAAPRPLAELAAPPPPPLHAAEVAAATFPRAPRGYAPAEVDAFLTQASAALARLEAGMAGADAAPDAAEVDRHRFSLAPRGYEMHAVDTFLVRLADRLEAAERAAGPEPDRAEG